MAKILIVEDNVAYANKLKLELNDLGEIETRFNVSEAINFMDNNPDIYLLILDLHLDDYNGNELLDYIKLNEINIKRKLILSSDEQRDSMKICYDYDIDHYMKKNSMNFYEIYLYVKNKMKYDFEKLSLPGVVINELELIIIFDDKKHFFSYTEFEVAKMLLHNVNKVLRVQDFEIIWEKENKMFSKKTFYNIISKLKKIKYFEAITTIPKIGYVLKK